MKLILKAPTRIRAVLQSGSERDGRRHVRRRGSGKLDGRREAAEAARPAPIATASLARASGPGERTARAADPALSVFMGSTLSSSDRHVSAGR